MKNLINKTHMIAASASLAVVFGLFMAAFPAAAHAQYYGGYGYAAGSHYCSYPQTASVAENGFFYCTDPQQYTAPAPVYQAPVYQPPVYVPPPVIQYQALNAYCTAPTNTYIQTGQSVTWSAYATGGTGSYTYSWNTTDGLYGTGQSVALTYYNPGSKNTTLTVYSGNQSVNVSCPVITVYQAYAAAAYYAQPYYNNTFVQTPVYSNQNNNSGLDVGCYVDPSNAAVNQPVTWNAEVTGGVAPYTYSWTGSDGLTSTSKTPIMYYQSSGEKNAVVTVTSANGQTSTRACSNTVKIGTHSAGSASSAAGQSQAQQSNGLGAAAFFSLNNVPWGWVATLVILVLIGTVFYLLFNRPKI